MHFRNNGVLPPYEPSLICNFMVYSLLYYDFDIFWEMMEPETLEVFWQWMIRFRLCHDHKRVKPWTIISYAGTGHGVEIVCNRALVYTDWGQKSCQRCLYILSMHGPRRSTFFSGDNPYADTTGEKTRGHMPSCQVQFPILTRAGPHVTTEEPWQNPLPP